MTPTPATQTIRQGIADLPGGVSHGERPSRRDIYLPPSHFRALDPDTVVVTGMRGAGKTFWWSALQDEDIRRLVATQHRRWPLGPDTEIGIGFGVTPQPDDFPGKDVLAGLSEERTDTRLLWRAVTAYQLAKLDHPLRKQRDWRDRVAYVAANPETIDRLLHERDAELASRGAYAILLFDALDRTADDRDEMSRLLRGLLQVALELRSYRRLRAKIFLRPDQVEEPVVSDFPDASKILATAAELTWPRRELYGLLWHYLSDTPAREILDLPHESPLSTNADEAAQTAPVSRRFIADEDRQREKFHEITGPWMGPNPRRGFPYIWIPNHLGDAKQRVSPRPFLITLRRAAEDTESRYPEHRWALHYESIKSGVREASHSRVSELREDYPWIDRFLKPLRGLLVPCRFRDISERWRKEQVFDEPPTDEESKRLPPSRIGDGPAGVREELEALGIFQRLLDGRVNMQDVFRVGYGIGRKGGVKPVR